MDKLLDRSIVEQIAKTMHLPIATVAQSISSNSGIRFSFSELAEANGHGYSNTKSDALLAIEEFSLEKKFLGEDYPITEEIFLKDKSDKKPSNNLLRARKAKSFDEAIIEYSEILINSEQEEILKISLRLAITSRQAYSVMIAKLYSQVWNAAQAKCDILAIEESVHAKSFSEALEFFHIISGVEAKRAITKRCLRLANDPFQTKILLVYCIKDDEITLDIQAKNDELAKIAVATTTTFDEAQGVLSCAIRDDTYLVCLSKCFDLAKTFNHYAYICLKSKRRSREFFDKSLEKMYAILEAAPK